MLELYICNVLYILIYEIFTFMQNALAPLDLNALNRALKDFMENSAERNVSASYVTAPPGSVRMNQPKFCVR